MDGAAVGDLDEATAVLIVERALDVDLATDAAEHPDVLLALCAVVGVAIGLACAALSDRVAADLEFGNAREAFLTLGAQPDVDRLDALTGRPPSAEGLSDRERAVLAHLAAGESNKEIAEALMVTPHKVRRHVEHIFTKLGVTSRAAATAYAYRHGLLERAE